MSPLAHRRFLKMNGLGNEIVVLDLRGTDLRVQPAEARAIAADPASRFDQMMVLHDPVTPGTDAYVRIYNTDGSEAGAAGGESARGRSSTEADSALTSSGATSTVSGSAGAGVTAGAGGGVGGDGGSTGSASANREAAGSSLNWAAASNTSPQ